jgi:acyl transferase domain-containing protein
VNGFGFGGTNGHVVVSAAHVILGLWKLLIYCIPDDKRSART